MTTIDLSTPPPAPDGLLDGLPRRVTLTLPELRLVAEHAGGAPLPFEPAADADAGAPSALEGRLGASRGTLEERAHREALAGLHDPTTSLTRRGVLTDDGVDAALLGAVGLLATPEVAVDVDVAVDGVQVKAWHRQAGDAVAALATADGIAFELAWYPTSAWPAELGRVAVLPEDLPVRESLVPPVVDLPFELADAATEAAGGREDLVAVLAARHAGAVLDADGRPVDEAATARLLHALGTEAQGRLRVLVARVGDTDTTVVGVRSWVLLADGWRTLHPHHDTGTTRVEIRSVEPSELAADLAPVLSEVIA